MADEKTVAVPAPATDPAPVTPVEDMRPEDRVLAAIANMKAKNKEAEPKPEPEPAKEQPKQEATPAVKVDDKKPEPAGLEKTWANVLKVDKEARELRQENKKLVEEAEKNKELAKQVDDAKQAMDFIAKLKADPYAVLAKLDIDIEKLRARKATGGKPTTEERLEEVEATARKLAEDKEKAEQAEAIKLFKEEAAKLIPEHANDKVTVDEIYDTVLLHFQQTGDIMEVEDAVTATLEAKSISKEPPKKEAPVESPKKTVADEPKAPRTLTSELGSAAPEGASGEETTDRELLLERALKKYNASRTS